MASCEFSESLFESYHARQFERKYESIMPQYIPTRIEEGTSGIDMAHFSHFFSAYFQYKVPKSLKGNTYRCIGLTGNKYNFHVYNRPSRRANPQFQTLYEWTSFEANVFYCLPNFNTQRQFFSSYSNILDSTCYFKVSEMMDPHSANFNDENHYVYFDDTSNKANMYSEEKLELKKYNAKTLFPDPEQRELIQITSLQKHLIERFEILRGFVFERMKFGNQLMNFEEDLNLFEKANNDDKIGMLSYWYKEILNLNWFLIGVE